MLKTIDEYLAYYDTLEAKDKQFMGLTPLEAKVALLTFAGMDTKRMSKRLNITASNIGYKRSCLLNKMNCFSREGIIKKLKENQVFNPDFLFSLAE